MSKSQRDYPLERARERGKHISTYVFFKLLRSLTVTLILEQIRSRNQETGSIGFKIEQTTAVAMVSPKFELATLEVKKITGSISNENLLQVGEEHISSARVFSSKLMNPI